MALLDGVALGRAELQLAAVEVVLGDAEPDVAHELRARRAVVVLLHGQHAPPASVMRSIVFTASTISARERRLT